MGSPYTVKEGDTLSAIARSFGIPLGAIQEKNPGLNPNQIKPGQEIELPTYDWGTTTTYADPNTARQWDSPFSMFPTPGSADPSMAGLNSWGVQPQLMPKADPTPKSPDGLMTPQAPKAQDVGFNTAAQAPAKDYTIGMPLEEASAKARGDFVNMGNQWLDQIKGHLEYPGQLASGERKFDINDAIPWAVDMGLMMIGGGAAGGNPFTRGVRGKPHAASEPLPPPAPTPTPGPMNLTPGMEWPRPFDFSRAHRDAKGNYGGPPLLEGKALEARRAHYANTEGARTADKASTAAGEDLHMKGLIEAEHNKLLGTTPPKDFRRDFHYDDRNTLGSGAGRKDSNVIPFDPNAKHLTDPKTNLERRMARRGKGNQVVGQERYYEKQTDKYVADTRKEIEDRRSKQSFAKGVPEDSMARIQEDVSKMSPKEWMAVDAETKSALMKEGIMPKFVKDTPLQKLIDKFKALDEGFDPNKVNMGIPGMPNMSLVDRKKEDRSVKSNPPNWNVGKQRKKPSGNRGRTPPN